VSQYSLQNSNFIQIQENSRFEKIRKSIFMNKENTIRDSEIERSNLFFIFFLFTIFYFSLLLLSLFLSLCSSLSKSRTKPLFFSPPLFASHLLRERLFFFFSLPIELGWTQRPNTNTLEYHDKKFFYQKLLSQKPTLLH
jgi:hypothetical protein